MKTKKTKPKKLTKKLTHVVVRQLVAKGKPGETGDAGCLGLRLLVLRPGRGSWLFRYRRPGSNTPANLTLGAVDIGDAEPTETPQVGDALTLASVHSLVADLRRQVVRGVDVGAVHIAEKKRARSKVDESDKSTYAAAVVAFVREYARPKQRRWAVNCRVLGLDPHSTDPEYAVIPKSLADTWGGRKVADITDDEITAQLDRCRYHGIPGLPRKVKPGVVTESRARTLYDCLSRLFSWLKRRGVVRVNPIETAEAPEGSGERDRKLNDDEIRWLWVACGDEHPMLSTALRLLLVTGQRLREITELEIDELGHDEAQMALRPNPDPSLFRVINLPPSRTKNKRSHTVHLSPLAVKLIDGVKPTGKFVFSHTAGKTPISVSGDVKKRLFARMSELARAEKGADHIIPHFVLHDLRHTFAKGCQRNNTPVNIIELCLNHVTGSSKGIAKYLSHDYPLECRAAMNNWATLLQTILASGHKLKLVS